MTKIEPILIRGTGVTSAERYLHWLCDGTFLSLWSHAHVFRDQGRQTTGAAKELCDLLVVFENDVLIFSDKNCLLQKSGDRGKDWNRWYRRAVAESAKQAWGAERWLREFPGKVYLDSRCEKPFPFEIPPAPRARCHIIVVAHGCAYGKGSAVNDVVHIGLDSWVHGQSHLVPKGFPPRFVVGDIDPDRTFVHVLPDRSLEILITTLDTISDFVGYLRKKESLFRSSHRVIASCEEDLLAFYSKFINDEGHHDFIFPRIGCGIRISDGMWQDFENRPERKRQLIANRISYAWDSLIEEFAKHAMNGTQYFGSDIGIDNVERILRIMAQESRTTRRALAKALLGIVQKGNHHQRATRYILQKQSQASYVFMSLEKPSFATEEDYRVVRSEMLKACCMVFKLKHRQITDIVGIATEPGIENDGRSEDAIYMDTRLWTTTDFAEAEKLAHDLEINMSGARFHLHEDEYPED